MSNTDDIMSGGKEFKPVLFQLGKPGDVVKGTYANVKEVQGKYGMVNIYEIKAHVGIFHPLIKDENENDVPSPEAMIIEAGQFVNVWGGRDEVDDCMRNSKIGDIVGIQFQELVKREKGKPYKKVLAKNFGVDKNYMGEDSSIVKEVFPGSEVVY